MTIQYQNREGLKITWKELKECCEAAGIRDDDTIDLISITWGDPADLTCKKDEDFGWQIVLETYN